MTDTLGQASRFSFAVRPVPVPADLRICWRLAIIVLMLDASRGKRASLVKLHILNDVLRSADSRARLSQIMSRDLPAVFWQMRVEPAFGRAIDLAIGNKLAGWVSTGVGQGLELLELGKAAARELHALPEILSEEKQLLQDENKRLTEAWARDLMSGASRV